MYTLLFLLLSVIPLDHDMVVEVDTIDCNFMFDSGGRHVLDQLIFWSPYIDNGKPTLHVDGWMLMSDARRVNQEEKAKHDAREAKKHEDDRMPYIPEFFGHPYLPSWKDGKYIIRAGCTVIKGKRFHTTITQYDPEILDRDSLPKAFRNPLIDTPSFITPHEFFRTLYPKQSK